MTDAFHIEEPKLADVVVHAAKLPRSKWKVLGSLAEFVSRVESDRMRPKAQRRPLDHIALVAVLEKDTDFAGVRTAHCLPSFVRFVQQHDAESSRSGVCGR